MKWIVFRLLLVITWSSVQALFTVETEQDSYHAEMHHNVQMGCRFSRVESGAPLTVIWQRIAPGPTEEVYRLERGLENNNFTNQQFRGRARLVMNELKNFRAVLQLSQLQIRDSGTYRCIIRNQEVDYKQTKLTIWAPYTLVKKNLRSTGKEVELSCQSQGFPLANVVWSDGRLKTQSSNITIETISDGTLNITSWVTVQTDVNNYTCSFETKDGDIQNATFLIPNEISESSPRRLWTAGVTVIAVILSVSLVWLILHKRRKGQTRGRSTLVTGCIQSDPNLTVTSTSCLLPNTNRKPDTLTLSSEVFKGKSEELREVLLRRYVTLTTANEVMSENVSPQQVLDRENRCLDIQSVLPETGEVVLLEGKKATGKTSVAKWLACSWASSIGANPLYVQRLFLVMLVDFEEAKGDLFQAVASGLPAEAGLEASDIKEVLLGPQDSLLILDGYKQGDTEVDESLVEFLKAPRACRVLITASPGEHSTVGETARKVLRLQARPAQT